MKILPASPRRSVQYRLLRHWLCPLALGLSLSGSGLGLGMEPGAQRALLLGVGELPASAQLRSPAQRAALLTVSEQFPYLDRSYLTPERIAGPAAAGALQLPELAFSGSADTLAPDQPLSWRQRLRARITRLGSTTVEVNPERVARLLGQVSDGVRPDLQSMATDLQDRAMRTLVDTGIDELERLEGTFLRNLELRYRTPLGDRDAMLGIEALVSLWDTGEQTLIGQVGGVWQDDAGSFNTGLGYRHLVGDGDGAVLLGTNVFYDYLADPSLQRYSVGVEAKSKVLDLYANWYQAVGGRERLNSGEQAYTPDGWDIELAGRIPQLPWVEFSGQYFRWQGELGQADDEGIRYAINLQPVPLFSLEAQYENPERGSSDWGVEAKWQYRFGVALSEQLRPQRVQAQDPRQRRFEQVERSYEMRVERGLARVGNIVETRVDGVTATAAGEVRAETAGMTTVQAMLNVPGARAPGSATLQELGLRVELLLAGTATAGEDYELSAARASGAAVLDADGATVSMQLTTDGRYRLQLEAIAEEVELVLELMLTDDVTFEMEPESIVLELVSGNTVTLLQISDEGTGDDPALAALPAVSVTVTAPDPLVPLMEGAPGTPGTTAMLTLSASSALTSDITVSYLLSGDLVGYTLTGHPGESDPTQGTVVLPMAGTPVILTLTVVDDAVTEPLQLVRFLLQPSPAAAPTYRLGSPSSAQVEVAPSDPEIRFVATSAILMESPVDSMEVALQSAEELLAAIDVGIRISGTAAPDLDYRLSGATGASLDRSVNLPERSREASLSLASIDDELVEGTELVVLELMPGPGYAVAAENNRFELSIMDSDRGVQFASTADSVNEGETATVVVQVSEPADTVLLVGLTLGGSVDLLEISFPGLLVAGGGTERTLILEADSREQMLQIQTRDNDFTSGPRNLRLTLNPGPGYLPGAQNVYDLTIRDDEALDSSVALVSFAASSAVVSEGGAAAFVDLNILNPADGPLNIAYQVASASSATLGVDYTDPGSSITAIAGSTSVRIRIPLLDDELQESREELRLELTAPAPGAGYELGFPRQYSLFIDDDDLPVGVLAASFQNPTAAADEGFSASIPVVLNQPGSVEVRYELVLGSGAGFADARDYTPPSNRVLFSSSASENIVLFLPDDAEAEGAETLRLRLLPAADNSYQLGSQSELVLTIRDDDVPGVSFAADNVGSANEGDVGDATPVRVQVRVVPPSSSALMIPIVVNAGETTAVLDTDFRLTGLALSGSSGSQILNVTASAPTAEFSVEIIGDTAQEGLETIRLDLGTATPATAYQLTDPSSYTLRLVDNDVMVGLPLVSFAANSGTDIMENGGTSTTMVQVQGLAPGESLTIQLQIAGDAELSTDYTLASAGTLSAVAGSAVRYTLVAGLGDTALTVTAIDNLLSEADELVRLELLTDTAVPVTYALNAPLSYSVIIEDDDLPTLEFASATSSFNENEGLVSVMVTATPPPPGDMVVSYQVLAGGTATANVDYTALSGSLTFRAASASEALLVVLLDDLDDEPSETLMLQLQVDDPADPGYIIGTTSTHTLSIEDNDVPQLGFRSTAQTEQERTQTVTVFVDADPAPHQDVMIPLTLDPSSGNSATLGTDYTVSGVAGTSPDYQLVLAAGASSVDFDITIVADAAIEIPESVTFRLGSPTPTDAAVLSVDSTYTLTLDDRAPPTVNFTTANQALDESAGDAVFMLGLTRAAGDDRTDSVPVTLRLGGSAELTNDYTLDVATQLTPVTGTPGAYTVSAGNTAVPVTISVVDDSDDEQEENVSLALLGGAGYRVGSEQQRMLTITDNDEPVLSFAQPAGTVSEDAGRVQLSLNADVAPAQDLTLTYTVAPGTGATLDSDYSVPATAVFPSGAVSALLEVLSVLDDGEDEENEVLTLTLMDGTAYSASGTSNVHVLTISDNDEPQLAFSVASASQVEGAAGAMTDVPVMVQAQPAPRATVTVPVAIGGTAALGTDYLLLYDDAGGTPQTVSGGTSFNLPVTSSGPATVMVRVLGDAAQESTEQVTLMLQASGGTGEYGLGPISSYTLEIGDDDRTDLPAAAFSMAAGTIAQEDGGTATVTVALTYTATPVAAGTVDVLLDLGGSAMQPADFTQSAPLVLMGGARYRLPISVDTSTTSFSASFTVTAVSDALDEPTETAVYDLAFGDDYRIGATGRHTISIEDGTTPELSFMAGTMSVDEGAGVASIIVSSNLTLSTELVVPYTITAGTATAGADYTAPSPLSVTLAGGTAQAMIQLPILDDDADEEDEQLTLQLSAPGTTDYQLGSPSSHVLTISDNDEPQLVFSVASASQEEGAAGAMTDVMVMVQAQPVPRATVMVPVAIGGPATLGTDYQLLYDDAGGTPQTVSGGTSFNLPVTSSGPATVTLRVLGDDAQESTEQVTLMLQAIGGTGEYGLGPISSYTLEIGDDDRTDLPTATFSVASGTIMQENGGTATVTVALTYTATPAAVGTVDVLLDLGGSAALPADFTQSTELVLVGAPRYRLPISIDTSTTSFSESFTVTAVLDVVDEPTETAVYDLAFGDDYRIGATGRHTVSIEDTTTPELSFMAGTMSVDEDAGVASIVVSSSLTLSTELDVPYTITAGTATAGADYTDPSPLSVTLAGGTDQAMIQLPILDDAADEEDEQLTLQLSVPGTTDYQLGSQSSHVLTITDNDEPQLDFSVASASQEEGAASEMTDVLVMVQAQPAPRATVMVPVNIGGPATLGTDYLLLYDDAGGTPQTVPSGDTSFNLPVTSSGPATVTVRVLGDDAQESTEQVTLMLQASGGTGEYGLGPTSSYTLEIGDDDRTDLPTAVFNVAASTIVEEDMDPSMPPMVMVDVVVDLTYTATPAAVGTVDVLLDLGGSAMLMDDFTQSTPLVLMSGERYRLPISIDTTNTSFSASFTVTAVSDALDELTETAVYDLAFGDDYRIGATGRHTVSIEDATTPTLSFMAGTMSVDEAAPAGVASIVVSADSMLATDLVVPYTITAGTATAGADYMEPSPLSVTLARGTAQGMIQLPILDDDVDEEDEQLTLDLTPSIADYQLGVAGLVLTITDNDMPQLRFSIASASQLEGAASEMTDVLVMVEAQPVPRATVMVPVDISGTAVLGTDYQLLYEDAGGTPQTVPSVDTSFNLPVTSSGTATVMLRVLGDDVDETDEEVTLTLGTAPVGTSLGTPASYTLTIINDDGGATRTAQFGAESSSIEEGDTTGESITVTVTSVPDPGETVTVLLRLSGSATTPADYALAGIDLSSGMDYMLVVDDTGTAAFTLSPVSDLDIEGNEEVIFSLLSTADYRPQGNIQHVLTITDDDLPTIGFTQAASSTDEDAGIASIAVTITPALQSDLTLNYTVAAATTATEVTDYQALPGTLSLLRGQTSANLLVTVVDDGVSEPTESLVLTLTAEAAAYVPGGNPTHTLTITDDDEPQVSFQMTQSSVAEGANVSITVQAQPAPQSALMVPLTLAPGAGLTDTEYSLSSTALTGTGTNRMLMVPVTGTVSFDVTATFDLLVENTESLTFTLGPGTGYAPGTDSTHRLNLTDLPPFVVDFATAAVSQAEGDSSTTDVIVQLMVDRPGGRTGELMVLLRRAGSAALTNDYTLAGAELSGGPDDYMLSIGASASSASFTVQIVGDAEVEGAEQVEFSLMAGSAGAGGYVLDPPSRYTLTIDDDDLPTIGFMQAASSINEDAGIAGIAVTITPALQSDLTLAYSVGGATTATAVTDYQAPPGTLLLRRGQTSANLLVTVVNDNVSEPTEALVLMLTAEAAAYVPGSNPTHTLTITDDDEPQVSFQMTQSSVAEGATVSITVQAQPAPQSALMVPLTLTLGSGLADTEYSLSSTALTGTGTNRMLMVPVTGTVSFDVTATFDLLVEGTESLTFTLGSGTGYELGTDSTHRLNLTDLPPFVVDFATATMSQAEGDSSTTDVIVQLMVDRPGGRTGELMVLLRRAGSATLTNDYTLAGLTGGTDDYMLSIGASATSASFTVQIVGDTEVEGAEQVEFSLMVGSPGAGGYVLDPPSRYTLTIDDDDLPMIGFTQPTSSINEDAGIAGIAVTITPALQSDLTLAYTVAGATTATEGTDYQALPGTLLLRRGQASVNLLVTVVNNDLSEPDENLVLMLTENAAAYVPGGNPTHTLTITDDDEPQVSFQMTQSSVAEGANVSITVQVQPVPQSALMVPLTLMPGSGLADTEYSLSSTALTGTGTNRMLMVPVTGTVSFDVTAGFDLQVENTESLTFTLGSGPGYALGTDSTHRLNLTDLPPFVVDFATAAVSQAEGDSDTTDVMVQLMVARPGGRTGTFMVPLRRAGSAALTSDYTLAGLTGGPADYMLSIGASASSASFTVEIVGDTEVEGAEQVEFSLMATNIPGANGYVLDTPSRYTLTINNDDVPEFSFTASSAQVPEDVGNADFMVVSDLELEQAVDVSYSITPVSPASPADYTTPLVLQVRVPAGPAGTEGTLSLPIVDDGLDEPNEVLMIALIAGSGYSVSSGAGTYTLTITDNDVPLVRFATGTSGADEGQTVTVQVNVSPVSHQPLTVPVTIEGSADRGEDMDYTLSCGGTPVGVGARFDLSIGAGAGMQTCEAVLAYDDNVESQETVDLTLLDETAPEYDLGSVSTHEVDIVDVPPPQVRFSRARLQVGEQGTGRAQLIVARASNDPRTAAVDVQIELIAPSGGVQAEAGTDYTLSVAGSVVDAVEEFFFLTVPSASPLNLLIAGVDDTQSEPAESVILRVLRIPSVRPGSPSELTLSIVDDDEEPIEISFSVSQLNFASEDGSIQNVQVTASAPAPSTGLTIPITIVSTEETGVTAAVDSDYTLSGLIAVNGGQGVNIARGARSAQFVITTMADALDEANPEVGRLVLAAPADDAGYTLGAGAGVLNFNIPDADVPQLSFSRTSATIDEGASTTIELIMRPAPFMALDADLAVLEGARAFIELDGMMVADTPGSDADLFPLTFPARANNAQQQVSLNLSVASINDELVNPNRIARLRLEAGTGYTVSSVSNFYELTVLEDDVLPSVRISADSSATTVEEGEGSTAEIEVEGFNLRGAAITITYTLGGTATRGTDYTVPDSLVLDPADGISGMITITTIDDSLNEASETVVLTVSSGEGYIVDGENFSHTLTIEDNDQPEIFFDPVSATVAEDVGTVTLNVSASPAPAEPLSIPIAIVSATLSAGEYSLGGLGTASGGRMLLNFPASMTQASFTVQVNDDSTFESGLETLVLELEAGSGYARRAGNMRYTLSVEDNDASGLQVSFPAGTSEVAEDAGSASVPVRLSEEAPLGGIAIRYRFTAATSTASRGPDFTPAAGYGNGNNFGLLQFAPGDTQAAIPFSVISDPALEADETISIRLLPPASGNAYQVAAARDHVVTILDDDTGTVEFVPPLAVSRTEGADGSMTDVSVTVRRTASGGNLPALTVPVMIDGSVSAAATLNTDFMLPGITVSGGQFTLSFAEDVATQSFDVRITGDNDPESNEQIVLNLVSPPDGYLLRDSSRYTVNINNDDTLLVTFAQRSSQVMEGAGALSIVVTASATRAVPVPVGIVIEALTASSADYTLQNADGTPIPVTDGRFSLNVSALSNSFQLVAPTDSIDEPDETLRLELVSGEGYAPRPTGGSIPSFNRHQVTIQDGDVPQVTFLAATADLFEGDAVAIDVRALPAPLEDLSVPLTLAEENGLASSEYTLSGLPGTGLSRTLLFPARVGEATETTARFTLQFNSDTDESEAVERLRLTLAAPTGGADYSLGDPSEQVLNITDDSGRPDTSSTIAATQPSPLTEAGLNGAQLTVRLPANTYVSSLQPFHFLLLPVPDGVSVRSATRNSDTSEATVVLDYDGTDLTMNGMIGVTVLAAAHNGAIALASAPVPITDNVAPTIVTPEAQIYIQGIMITDLAIMVGNAESSDTLTVMVAGLPAGLEFAFAMPTLTISGTPTEQTTAQPVTITADDGVNDPVTATFTIAVIESLRVQFQDVQVAVTESAGATATLTILVAPVPLTEIQVGYRFLQEQSTATAGTDFTPAVTSATVTLTPTAPSADVVLTLSDDSTDESPSESALFELSAPAPGAGYLLGANARSELVIFDDDGAELSDPVVNFEPPLLDSGTEGETVSARLSLVPPPGSVISVAYSVAATGGAETADYGTLSGTLSVAAGTGRAELPIMLVDDSLVERGNENLTLTLTAPAADAGYTLGGQRFYSLRIIDNDFPLVAFSAATSMVDEPASEGGPGIDIPLGNVEVRPVTVNLAPAPTAPLWLRYRVDSASTAELHQDYFGLVAPGQEGSLRINAGMSSFRIGLVTPPDLLTEPPETLILQLLESDEGSYQLGAQSRHTLTFVDSGADGALLPLVLFGTPSSAEVTEGGLVTVPVQIENFAAPLSIALAVDGAQSTAAAADYTLPSATILNSATGTLSVQTNVDVDTDDEILVLQIAEVAASYAVGGLILGEAADIYENSRFVVRITDSAARSGPEVSFVQASSAIAELQPARSGRNLQVALIRSGATTNALTVSVAAVGRGDAEPGTDYNLPSSTVTFAVGQEQANVVVRVERDANQGSNVELNFEDRYEGDQVVELLLLPGTGYQLGTQSSHRVRIVDPIRYNTSASCEVLGVGAADCTDVQEGDTILWSTTVRSQANNNHRLVQSTFGLASPQNTPLEFHLCVESGASRGTFSFPGDPNPPRNPDFLLLNAISFDGRVPPGDGAAGLRGGCPNGTVAYRFRVPRGQAQLQVLIEVVDDDIFETARENSFLAGLYGTRDYPSQEGSGGDLPIGCNSVGFCLISDNDPRPPPVPSVSFAAPRMSSVEESVGSVTLPLTFEDRPDAPLQLEYRVIGQATPGADYRIDGLNVLLRTGRLLVPPTGMVGLTVTVLDDPNPLEPDRQLVLELLAQEGIYQVPAGTGRYELTITDDDVVDVDSLTQLSFAVAQQEVLEGSGSVMLAVTPILPATGSGTPPASVGYRALLSDSTAPGSAYSIVGANASGVGTVALTNGAGAIQVNLVDDSTEDSEPVQVLVIELIPPEPIVDYVVVGPQRISLRILDDDGANAPLSRLSFAAASATATEGDGSHAVVVSAVPPPAGPLTVSYQVLAESTAEAGPDYTALSGTLTIPAGSALTDLPIALTDDAVPETEDTLLLMLSEPADGSGYVLGEWRSYLLRITDDDFPVVAFSAATSMVDEPASEGGMGTNAVVDVEVRPMGMTVNVVPAPAAPLWLRYRVEAASTAELHQDYLGLVAPGQEGSLRINAGDSSFTIGLITPPDLLTEPSETLIVQLLESDEDSYQLGAQSRHTLTFADSGADGALLPLVLFGTPSSAELTEGGLVTVPVQIENFSNPLSIALVVDSAQSTAETSDYTLPSATTLSSATGTLSVQTSADVDTDDEILVLQIAEAASYNVGGILYENSRFVLRITDSAARSGPEVSFVRASSAIAEDMPAGSDRDLRVALMRSGATTNALTVSVEAIGRGDAVDGTDYSLPSGTVTFASGQNRANLVVSVARDATTGSNVEQDAADRYEGEQIVELLLLPGTGYQLGTQSSHRVRIVDALRIPAGAAAGCQILGRADNCSAEVFRREGGVNVREGDIIIFTNNIRARANPNAHGGQFGLTNPQNAPFDYHFCVNRGFGGGGGRVSMNREDNPDFLILNAVSFDGRGAGNDALNTCRPEADAYRIRAPRGQSGLRVLIEVVDDDIPEDAGDNAFEAEFKAPLDSPAIESGGGSYPVNCNLGGSSNSACTVVDNDPPLRQPEVGFNPLSSTMSEAAGQVAINIQANPEESGGVLLNYLLSGSAQLGTSYEIDGVDTATSSGQVFLLGDSATIYLRLLDDDLARGDQELILELQDGEGYTVDADRRRYTLSITDDD